MNKFNNINYRPDIDGLRALAVLSVVGFHAFPAWVKGGFIGVDIFFVISGFLISSMLMLNLTDNTFNIFSFYARRIKRIFPALTVVLIFCFVLGWFALLNDEYKQLGKHIAGGSSFISNFLLFNESGYFDNTAETKPLLHLWSLGIEEQFYLIWPLVLWVVWKNQFRWLPVFIILFATSILINTYEINRNEVAAFYLPMYRFWELIIGSILAWACLYNNLTKQAQGTKNEKQSIYGNILNKLTSSNSNIISIAGFSLILASLMLISKDTKFPGVWALLPTTGAALVILGGQNAFVNRKLLSNPYMVWFGLISFPLYLWHWPILSFANIINSGMPNRYIRMILVIVSFLLATLTYQFIEKPIRFGSKSKNNVVMVSLLMLLIGLGGYHLYLKDGYTFRGVSKHFINNENELIRTPPTDKACIAYINDRSNMIPYCRYSNIGSKNTVAVIGDSHAHVAYPGIAQFLKKQGKANTLLLANSSCPPFLGAEHGVNELEKAACKKRIEYLIKIITAKKEIKKVFILSRGPVYLTGKYFGAAETGRFKAPLIEPNLFKAGLQRTINELRAAGKTVFYVTENPELLIYPKGCMPRPLRGKPHDCALDANVVKARQAQYLKIINQLKGVEIINTIASFCPKSSCYPVRNKKLLYSDFDHLSIAGSKFQANKILSSYLLDFSTQTG